MKLTYEGIKDKNSWEKAGITLPSYDPAAIAAVTVKAPVWLHFGIGNIFRIFIGGIADSLISEGHMDKGITCAETFDYDVVDRIYDPFDNLVLAVTLHADGRQQGIERQADNGGRQGNPYVGAELVLHLAPLRLRGHYRGI